MTISQNLCNTERRQIKNRGCSPSEHLSCCDVSGKINSKWDIPLENLSSCNSQSKIKSNEVRKRIKKMNKLYDEIRSQVELDFGVTANMKLRHSSELDNIAHKLHDDYMFQRAQLVVIRNERKLKDKKVSLRRQQERFSELVTMDICEHESVKRVRIRLKREEYDLNRFQLRLSKEKHKVYKRAFKEKRRLDLIDFYNSFNFDVESLDLEYNSMGFSDVNMLSGLVDTVSTLLSDVYSGLDATTLIALVNFIVVMMVTQNKAARTIAAVQIAASLNCSMKHKIVVGILGAAVSYSGAIFQKNESKLQMQSLETLGNLATTLDKVLSNDFTKAIRSMFIGLTTHLSFPREFASKIFTLIGTTPDKISGVRLIKVVLDVIVKIGRSAALWYYGNEGERVPLSEILFGASLHDGLKERYQRLDLYKEHTYAGLPVRNHMCQFNYMRQSREFLETAKAYSKAIGRYNDEYKGIQEMILKVQKWSMAVENKIRSANRIPAFAVMIFGDPGTGKSLTTQLLCSRIAAIRGYEFSNDHIYYKNADEEWWEGYRPQEHNIVFMSELAKMTPKRAETSGDPAMDAFLSCCDSNPYNVKMAFEGKGCVPFLSELFLCDANNSSLNLSKLYSNPAAFWRRILCVQQLVLEKYRKAGSCEIDGDKVTADIESGVIQNFFDAYRYNVYRQVPISISKVERKDILSNVTYKELVVEFDNRFIKHQMHNSYVNSKVLEIVRNIPCTNPQKELFAEKESSYNKPVSEEVLDKIKGVYGDVPDPHLGPAPAVILNEAVVNYKRSIRSFIDKHTPSSGLKRDILNYLDVKIDTEKDIITDDVYIDFKDSGIRDNMSYVDVHVMESLDPTSEYYSLDSFDDKSGPNQWYVDRGFLVSDIRKLIRMVPDETGIFQHDDRKEFSPDRFDSVNFVLTHPLSDSDSIKIADKEVKSLIEDMKTGNYTLSNNEIDRLLGLLDSYVKLERPKTLQSLSSVKRIVRSIPGYCCDFLYDVFHTFFWMIQYALLLLFMSTTRLLSVIEYTIPITLVLMYYISVVFGLWFFFISVSCLCIYPRIAKKIIYQVIKSKFMFEYMKCKNLLYTLRDKITGSKLAVGVDTLLVSRLANNSLFCVCSLYVAYRVVTVVMKAFRKMVPVETNAAFSKFDGCETIESDSGCALPYKRVKPKTDPWSWNVMHEIHPSYPFKNDYNDFKQFVQRNTDYCFFVRENGDRVSSHCFGVKGKVAMLNTHFHKEARDNGYKIYISITRDPTQPTHTISVDAFLDLGEDITLVLCTRSYKDVLPHFSHKRISMGASYIGDIKTVARFVNEHLKVESSTWSCYYVYEGYCGNGLCGNVLYAQVGTSFCILGMHCVGDVNGSTGFAMPTLQGNIKSGYDRLMSKYNLMDLKCQSNVSPIFSKLKQSINKKSPFMHIAIPHVEWYGSIGPALVNRNSTVAPNIFSDSVPAIEAITNCKQTTYYTAPMMKSVNRGNGYISPQNNALKHFCKEISMDRVSEASRAFNYLLPLIRERIKNEHGDLKLSPYTVENAINGYTDDDYLNRINASTAAGFNFPGKKSKYLPLSEDGVTREASAPVVERMKEILNQYKNGYMSDTIFNVALKDEPVTVKKAKEGNTRLFYVHELPHLIIARMFIGPLITLIQESSVFCSMVGTNTYKDADKLWEIFTKFPFYVEADAKKFDITASYIIRWFTYTLLYNIAEDGGYNEEALSNLNGVLSDLLEPYYVLDGELFSKPSVPSGHLGTAEMNCLILLMFYTICYLRAIDDGFDPKGKNMFDFISPGFYGDDQSASVHESLKNYVNNITLAKVYSDYNMELTASDKSSELKPFVDVSDATFLKRTFKFSNLAMKMVALLDPQSIFKMSSVSVFNENCTALEHAISIANSALGEWFLHLTIGGDNRFAYNKLRNIYMQAIIDHHDIAERDVPIFTYDKCLDIYDLCFS